MRNHRGVAFAIATALVVAAYAGLVLLTTRVLAFHTPIGVAVATVAAAALFNPLRRRVQRSAGRLNRTR